MVVDGELMLERPRRVVLLIDYDNLQICAARDTPGRDLQLPPVVQLAQRYGTVILARAYAEWNLSTERLAVYKAGIEPAFAPVLRTESDRSGKSLADTVMVAEGMDMLWTLSPDVVVLATSDKDLIPLVRVAKQRGAFVVVLGSDFTAIPLREMADEHFTYRQLVTDASGRFATEAGPGRQPAALPEPSRRRSVRDRTADRPARERVGAPSAATPAPARAEREPAQAAASSTPVAAPAAGEPVAPVTAGSAGEDAQVGGRRRRRRGSRRRSDRLGVGGEGAPYAEGEGGGSEGPTNAVEITPTTSDVEVAQASSGTVEVPAEASPPSEAGEAAAPAPAAPRSRRRSTRRPATETAAAPTEESAAAPASATPPESEIVAPTGESSSTNGAAPTDDAATAAPRTRPRRVASASRGRTRRA
jgi:hypothetical protein